MRRLSTDIRKPRLLPTLKFLSGTVLSERQKKIAKT